MTRLERVTAALDGRLKQHWLDREPLDPAELAKIAIEAIASSAKPAERDSSRDTQNHPSTNGEG